jgi:hypothetical protein
MMSTKPPILEGCDVLPPMHQGNGSPRRHQGDTSKAKGKPSRRNTADRFAVLNAFVDFTMQELSRAEALVWLVLYRDTKDSIARTAQTDIARRAGVNVGTVKRAMTGLRRRGLLTVVFRGSLRRGPSAYRVYPLTRDTAEGAPALPDKGAFCTGNRVRRRALSHKGTISSPTESLIGSRSRTHLV